LSHTVDCYNRNFVYQSSNVVQMSLPKQFINFTPKWSSYHNGGIVVSMFHSQLDVDQLF